MNIKQLKKWINDELRTTEEPIYIKHNKNVLRTAIRLLEGESIMGVKLK